MENRGESGGIAIQQPAKQRWIGISSNTIIEQPYLGFQALKDNIMAPSLYFCQPAFKPPLFPSLLLFRDYSTCLFLNVGVLKMVERWLCLHRTTRNKVVRAWNAKMLWKLKQKHFTILTVSVKCAFVLGKWRCHKVSNLMAILGLMLPLMCHVTHMSPTCVREEAFIATSMSHF